MPKPDLNLTHIVSFSEVAKYGSLIKAAARSTISEATLSRHVKSLERALNLNLFERSANQLSLTKAGTELLVFARSILDASSRFLTLRIRGELSGAQAGRECPDSCKRGLLLQRLSPDTFTLPRNVSESFH